MKTKDTTNIDRESKYLNILDWIKKLSIPEKERIIDEIQIDNYFDTYDNSEVIKTSG